MRWPYPGRCTAIEGPAVVGFSVALAIGLDRRAFIAHGLAVILGSGIGYAQPVRSIPRIGSRS